MPSIKQSNKKDYTEQIKKATWTG